MVLLESIPIAVWAFFLIPLGLYEALALIKGYRWTLTAGMRFLMKRWPPLRWILGAFIAWLFWHFIMVNP